MSKPVVSIEDLSKLHITRRNVPNTKGLCQLVIAGTVVGQALATHTSTSQRYWNAQLEATINGADVKLEMDHVFSAIKISNSFTDAIKFQLTDGAQGRALEEAIKEHGGYGIPKPKAPKAEAQETPPTPPAEGEQQPETPAAEAKPARKGSGKGSSKK